MLKIKDPEIFRAILENLQIGVCLVDREHRIILWNEGAERITGFLKQEVLGHCRTNSLFVRQDDPGSACALDLTHPVVKVLRDGQRMIVEASVQHKSGHQVPVRLTAGPIRDEQGTIIGAAESFDEGFGSSERNRRQSVLAAHGVLDEATGVACFRFVETQLREQLTMFESYPIPFSVLCIQIDGMDHVRSTFGAGAVPVVLRTVAQTMENCIRPSDWLGHWFEDRFLCILTECPESQVATVAGRLQDCVHHDEIRWWGEHFTMTISLGGASARQGDTTASLLERAEHALRESAKDGGNLSTVQAYLFRKLVEVGVRMFSIIGIVVVFGAVVAGYLMEHGNLRVLMQPSELIIILGAAIGTVFIANPMHILKDIGKGIVGAFGKSPFTKEKYASSQVDHRKAGRLAEAIQVAFQELGVFQTSSTKIPVQNDNAIPFETVQIVENVVKAVDLKSLVNPMKGQLTNSAEAQSLLDAEAELRKALAPEIDRKEVTMEMNREGLVISLKELGFFDSGSATVRTQSMDAITRLAEVLGQRFENIRFEGHTDNVPIHNSHFESNWQLSTARATTMIQMMITKYGLPAEHLSAAGYAEFHPAATNATPEGRSQNRRLDIVVLIPSASPSLPVVSGATAAPAVTPAP
jgi:chemotaxis protein MotB